jgi:hypothetical protein
MNKLLVAFVIFGIIDLILVGTTCINVVLLVRKILRGELKINFTERGK